MDGGLNKGLSNAGIAAGLVAMGGKMDPETIGRHKRGHWTAPIRPDAPRPTKRDAAIVIRDRVLDAIEALPKAGDVVHMDGEDEDGNPTGIITVQTDPILNKELAPMIGRGLAAQAAIDKREVNEKKLGLAAGAMALQAWLAGLGNRSEPPPELDDGTVIEGESHEVD